MIIRIYSERMDHSPKGRITRKSRQTIVCQLFVGVPGKCSEVEFLYLVEHLTIFALRLEMHPQADDATNDSSEASS